MARSALAAPGNTLGHTAWESQLPLLMDCDVRGISDREDGQLEGRKQLSWIWKVVGVIGQEVTRLWVWLANHQTLVILI